MFEERACLCASLLPDRERQVEHIAKHPSNQTALVPQKSERPARRFCVLTEKCDRQHCSRHVELAVPAALRSLCTSQA